jgi:carbonic anhydrase
MRRRGFLCLACQAGLALAATPASAQHAHYGYSGREGPADWGNLDPKWQACSVGVNQSPVDLAGFIEARLPSLGIAYGDVGREVVNTGHSIQVNAAPGATLAIDGKSFTLLQFHFHAPGEHTLEGTAFPLEAHLVHQSADGDLAVIGVFFTAGAPNDLLGLVAAGMPLREEEKRPFGTPVPPAGLLPSNRDYIRYNGSLTTPPCSEGVRWLLMKQTMTASAAQIAAIAGALGFANNRPVQAVKARAILR